jgi:hypothetical protein
VTLLNVISESELRGNIEERAPKIQNVVALFINQSELYHFFGAQVSLCDSLINNFDHFEALSVEHILGPFLHGKVPLGQQVIGVDAQALRAGIRYAVLKLL